MRDYGMTAESVAELALMDGHPVVLDGGTYLSGETAALGQVLAKDADGKLVGLALEQAVADEVLAAGDGSAKVFEGFLANGGVIPGSVIITATVGAAAKEMTDNGQGGLAGAGVGIGFIDYASGYFRLIYDTAPDNATNVVGDYSHDAAGKAKAASVAPEAVDASEGDEPGVIIRHGELRLTALVWPDSITDAQKARALQQLAEAGIYVS